MNEQLQNALSTLVHKSLEAAEKGAAFLSEEIPEVVMQLLMWHGVYNFILFLLALVVVVVHFWLEKKVFKWCDESDKKNSEKERCEVVDAFVNIYMGFFSLVRIASLILFDSLINLTWLKIWIAPKVWLLEYAATFAK